MLHPPRTADFTLSVVLTIAALLVSACQMTPASSPTAVPKVDAEASKPAVGNPAAGAIPTPSPVVSRAASPAAAAAVAAKPGPDIPIGVNLELSGSASVWGQPELNAINMLVELVNAQGGINGSTIKIIAYDNESNEDKSLVNVKRLIEEDKVVAVVGAGTNPMTMSTVPAVQDAQVPMISIGGSNAIVEPVGQRRWVFKTPSSPRDVARTMIVHMKSKRIARVGFLSVDNAHGEAGVREFGAISKELGLLVTGFEKFGDTDTDVKPQLTRIRSQDPDAVVAWADPPSASIVDRNYRGLGLTLPLYHDHGATSWDYQALSGDANDNAFIVTAKSMIPELLPDSDPVKAVATEYKKQYEARFNKRAGGNDAMSYDAMLLLTRALGQSGPDRARLRDALEGLRNVVGATGVFNMSPQDHNGITTDDLVVVQVKGRNWTLQN